MCSRYGSVTVCLALWSFCAVLSGASEQRGQGKYHVGFRILRVDDGTDGTLVVALWYPTRSAARRSRYLPVIGHLEGCVALDAEPAEGPFPLVVFSHGGIGAGACAMAWAEGLAAQGFVVAAPDHKDKVVLLRSDAPAPPTRSRAYQAILWAMKLSRTKQRGSVAVSEYQHRPREIRATIDELIQASADADSPLHGLVDAARIGLTGVSFGAWTTLAMAGAVPWYRDGRIKAAVPMAPPVGNLAVARIRIPLMFIFGEKETIVLLDKRPSAPLKEKAVVAEYGAANAPKFLVGIQGAEHLDFDADGMMTRASLRGRGMANRNTYTTAEVHRRDPVIRTILRFQLSFWQRYLLGDKEAERFLRNPDEPGVYLYRSQFSSRASASRSATGTTTEDEDKNQS